ncbi:unnamed protein product [Urochloa humidicola]
MAPVDPFAKRKKCLRTMAWELSVLCGVDVALVISTADGDAGGKEDAWESREGVMARYRALPPETRARHTHLAYLEEKLGKEVAKLARVRRGGPVVLRDAALDLDGVASTAEDARRLLDASIRAVDVRRAALGMPAHGGGDGGVLVHEGVAPVSSAPGVVVDGGDYHHHLPQHGGDADGHDAFWDNDGGGFQFQPFTCGAAGDVQPGGYGFQFQEQCATTTTGGGTGMDGYYYDRQLPPAMYGYSSSSHAVADAYPYYQVPRHAPQPNPNPALMWRSAAADAPRHGMVPDEYTSAGTGLISYYNYMVDTPAAPNASLQNNGGGGMSFATGATSGDFVYDSPPALSLATGNDIGGGSGGGNFISAPPTAPFAGDNFAYGTPAQTLAVSYGGELTDDGCYDAAEWQLRRDGGGQEPLEQLHYLSDLEDTQLHLWGN